MERSLIRCSQVAVGKAELSAAVIEYEKDINLVGSLDHNNNALPDQHNFETDLKELAGYMQSWVLVGVIANILVSPFGKR